MHNFVVLPGRDVVNILPGRVLRVGINLSNILLATGRTPVGNPVGVSPGMRGRSPSW